VAVVLANHLEHAVDDPLLGGRELATFDAGLEPAAAAEQGVDHGEHQLRFENQQASAAQRLDLHDVQVGRHDQVGEEGAVLLDLDGADGNLRVAPHEVEQAEPQVPREAVVDDLERRHPAAHDPFLECQVVGRDAVGRGRRRGRQLLAVHAHEQGVDLVLREKLFGHLGILGSAYWTMNWEKCTAAIGPVSTSSKLRRACPVSPIVPAVRESGRGGISRESTAWAATAMSIASCSLPSSERSSAAERALSSSRIALRTAGMAALSWDSVGESSTSRTTATWAYRSSSASLRLTTNWSMGTKTRASLPLRLRFLASASLPAGSAAWAPPSSEAKYQAVPPAAPATSNMAMATTAIIMPLPFLAGASVFSSAISAPCWRVPRNYPP